MSTILQEGTASLTGIPGKPPPDPKSIIFLFEKSITFKGRRLSRKW